MRYLKQSTGVTILVGPFVDVDDPAVAETGLTLAGLDDAELVKAGAGAVVDISGRTWAHIQGGHYNITLSTSDVDTLGPLRLFFRDEDVCQLVWEDFSVLPSNVYDSMFSTDKLQVDVTQWTGTTATLSSTSNLPEVDTKSISDSATAANNLETAAASSSLTCDATKISGSTTSADNLESAFSALTTDGYVRSGIYQIGEGSGDETAAGTLLGITRASPKSAVDDSGFAPTTTQFECSLTSAADDFYNGRRLVFASGALEGQATDVTDYDGANKRFTVDALTSAPAHNDTFVLYG